MLDGFMRSVLRVCYYRRWMNEDLDSTWREMAEVGDRVR